MRKALMLLSIVLLSYSLSNAQDFWQQTIGPTIGYIKSLVINSSGYIFAGTYDGGVFLSTDNVDHWTPVNGGLTNLHVWALAVNPSGYIFAATAGGGVLRSVQPTTAVKEMSKAMPGSFELRHNYPNPFNSMTMITYSLPKSDFVIIKIYNLSGHEVEILTSGHQSAGEHLLKWNAEGFPSGVYFLRLQAGEFSETKKFLLQK